jgi:hypothetical protein
VLEKYGLVEFVAVSEAIRTGNLRKFHDALLEYQHRFIRYVKGRMTDDQTVGLYSLHMLFVAGMLLFTDKEHTCCWRNAKRFVIATCSREYTWSSIVIKYR